MAKPIKVGIIGAAGLSAGRLLTLLFEHPGVEVLYLASESEAGQSLEAAHPHLRGVTNLCFSQPGLREYEDACDLFFLARHAGQAFEHAERLLPLGKRIIDLSADFRLRDADRYVEVYGAPKGWTAGRLQPLLDRACYGLAELNAKAIAGSQLVANPGCYPTSAILALAPLARRRLLPESAAVVIDSFSGISGAGKALSEGSLYMNVNENLTPYKTGVHRHSPEIEQEVTALAGRPQPVFFNPHVVPLDYGILTNIFIPAPKLVSEESLYGYYREEYQDQPFVRLLEPGKLPNLKDTQDSNFCDIGMKLDARTGWLRVSAALDNTVKGAGGQAVQCFNLMYGFHPTDGLPLGRSLRERMKG